MLVYQRVNRAIPRHGRFVVGCATSDDEHFFFQVFACAAIVTGKLLGYGMVWQGNRYIDIPASQKIGNITHEREGNSHRGDGIQAPKCRNFPMRH